MANRALCHLRLQENDGTAKVILVPAAEHKCVYRFRRASGFEPKSTGILRISLPRATRPASWGQIR